MNIKSIQYNEENLRKNIEERTYGMKYKNKKIAMIEKNEIIAIFRKK